MAYPEVQKATGFDALRDLAERVAQELSTVSAKVDELVDVGGEVNKIEKIKVNGTEQSIIDKAVDITVPTKTSDLENDSEFQTKTQVSTAVQDAVDVLNGEGEGSIKKKVDAAINEFATNVSNDDIVNTYKELIDYAAEHKTEAAAMASDIQSLKTKVQGIADGATKVEASDINGNIKINGAEQTVYTLPKNVLTGSWVTEDEVTVMLNEVFGA